MSVLIVAHPASVLTLLGWPPLLWPDESTRFITRLAPQPPPPVAPISRPLGSLSGGPLARLVRRNICYLARSAPGPRTSGTRAALEGAHQFASVRPQEGARAKGKPVRTCQ